MDSYERKFRRDRAVRLTLSALWIGFCTFLWKRFYFAVYAGSYGAVLSFAIGAVVTLWPLYKLDALRYLYDRSFSGIVTEVKRERVVKRGINPRAARLFYRMTLVISTDDGMTVKKRIDGNDPFYEDRWYHVGDRVVYHRGTKFPVITNGARFCAYCGSILRDDEEKCVECFNDAPINVNKE